MLIQVTSEPGLAPLLSELIHSTEGQEVRLREPADYHIHDLKKTSFAEVAEYARTKSETAIGYVLLAHLALHKNVVHSGELAVIGISVVGDTSCSVNLSTWSHNILFSIYTYAITHHSYQCTIVV